MKTYIALFRGINVGGKNVLPMQELIAILDGLGAKNVNTYIQSGNAVFQIEEHDISQFSHKITVEIKQHKGFEPCVLLLGLEGLEKAIEENPFPEAEANPKTLHLGFLASAPDNPDMKKIAALKTASERFYLSDRVFYLHAPEGVGRSKLAAGVEKLLGVPMTDRNWRTVCKIWEMAKV